MVPEGLAYNGPPMSLTFESYFFFCIFMLLTMQVANRYAGISIRGGRRRDSVLWVFLLLVTTGLLGTLCVLSTYLFGGEHGQQWIQKRSLPPILPLLPIFAGLIAIIGAGMGIRHLRRMAASRGGAGRCTDCGRPLHVRMKPLRFREFYGMAMLLVFAGVLLLRLYQETGTISLGILVIALPSALPGLAYPALYGWTRACRQCDTGKADVPEGREERTLKRLLWGYVVVAFLAFFAAVELTPGR